MYTISIIIPMRNEEKNVTKVIKRIMTIFRKYKFKGEIIAIDDRSTDKTGIILEELIKKYKLIKVIHRKGCEKGVEIGLAIKDGIHAAKYETIVITMGDLSDDPEDIVNMLKEIEKGYDFIVGSRFIKEFYIRGYDPSKLILNRFCNYFIKFLFNLKTNDISNAFKLYKRKILKNIIIESSGFEVFIEIPLKLIISDYKYTQIPVKWFGRKSGKSKLKLWNSGYAYFKTILKLWKIRQKSCKYDRKF